MPEKTDKILTSKAFEMTRILQAPRARVWQAWTDADQLQEWWGPKGCKLTVASLDFREGGFFHYAMQYALTPPMWGRFLYREISAPDQIVWLNSFSNERGGIARAPFGTDIPFEIQNTVTFTEMDGGTTVHLRAVPFGAPDAECRIFEDMFASLEQGYGGTLDQLAAHLTG
jgi:uncharacterized protein YndB with AHSA1/START domain